MNTNPSEQPISAFWRAWLNSQVFPLWTSAGINADTGLPFEALDMTAAPRRDLALRIRVPARQVYAFATAAQLFPEAASSLHSHAQSIFAFLSSEKVLNAEGRLAGKLSQNGDALDAPHELYDIAFFMLATAAMAANGHDCGEMLGRIDHWLGMLERSEGWAENAADRHPRRQNPHMHLFEASMALWQVLKRPQDAARMEACRQLFERRFLQDDAVVFEFFDAGWEPVLEGQAVEPGHMAEWIWLMDRYEHLTGRSSGVDLIAMWQAVLARQAAPALLADHDLATARTARLWPQTEFLKAALVMERRGHDGAAEMADAVMARLKADYLDPAPMGGWVDQRDLEGNILSDTMPASSLYHLLEAGKLWLETRPEGR